MTTPAVAASAEPSEATGVAKQRAERIQGLVQTYMHEHAGECPGSVDALRDGKGLLDPWDHPYRLQCPGTSAAVDVISNGPDGLPDTPDDVATGK